MLWTEKYAPRRLSEVVGQQAAIRVLQRWVEEWKHGIPAKRAVLFYGPPGTGKTATARALTRETGWTLIELNASDKRTMREIQRVLGVASTTGTLLEGTRGKKILVLDEADNIHGTADRGGYQAIRSIISTTTNPVILIANDKYSIPTDLQLQCEPVNFRRLSAELITHHLEKIARSERVKADRKALELIAQRAGGDMRSAIEDFQMHALVFPHLTADKLLLFQREREKSVFDLLSGVLFASSPEVARSVLWSTDVAPDEALKWIAENIPRAIKNPENLAMVYDVISRADIFYRRAKERQVYRLWSYMSDLMSAGVAVLKGDKIVPAKFGSPSYAKRYFRVMRTRRLVDSICKRIALSCHTSSRLVRRDMWPLFKVLKQDKRLMENLSEKLELDQAERELLTTL